MGRIWRDISKSWSSKLKCCKKRNHNSTVKVTTLELNNSKEDQEKSRMGQGRENKGYNGTTTEIHPFQIPE